MHISVMVARKTNLPKVSVIIPVYNSERTIQSCLESVLNQTYPNYEVILVDNNSKDMSVEIIKRYQVKIVYQRKQGSYCARNTGATIAEGDILVFLDSDCIVEKNWLKELVDPVVSGEEIATMGGTKNAEYSICSNLEQRAYEEYLRYIKQGNYVTKVDTKNFAIKKDVFEMMGGFDEYFISVGDVEFGFRLTDSNYKIRFVDNREVRHFHSDSLKTAAKRKYRQGYWSVELCKKHQECGDFKELVGEVKTGMILSVIAIFFLFIYPILTIIALLPVLYYLKLFPFKLLINLIKGRFSRFDIYADSYYWICSFSWKLGILHNFLLDATYKCLNFFEVIRWRVMQRVLKKTMGTLEFNRRVENRILSKWLNVKNKKILDLACGNGNFSAGFALRENNVTGIDLNKDRLEIAKKTAKYVKKDINFICGDALNLPFKDSTFDCILCNCSLEHFQDTDKTIEEMYRTLKVNGKAVVTTDSYPLRISKLLNYIPKKWIKGDIDSNKDIYTALKEYHRTEYEVVNYYHVGDLASKFKKYGFKVLEYRYYINSYFSKMIFELHLLLKKLRFNSLISQRLFPLIYPFTFLDKTKEEGHGLAILVARA